MSQRLPYSARSAIAAALTAYETVSNQRQDNEQRAHAAHDAAVRQARNGHQKAVAAAKKQADAERTQVSRLLKEIDQHLKQAESALSTAAITAPSSQPSPSHSAPGQTPEEMLISSQHAFVDAQHRLVDALQELERVRTTLLVRAMRKIGLPPL